MDELACFMDWDLESIVRGCPSSTATDPNPNNFLLHEEDYDLLFSTSFPEFSETTRVLDQLDDLYKPFYPVFHTSLSPNIQNNNNNNPLPLPKEPEDSVKEDLQVPTSVSKPKKSSKKSMKKREVKEVMAAEIGVCDAWAWRKYGQKPIKGSPYPRSYYRCSSSKGCLARKQVERNHLDPSIFLVTYSAQHNHPYPTRRNSLAGISRKNHNSLTAAPITATCSSSSNSSSMEEEEHNKGFIKNKQHELLHPEAAEFGDVWFQKEDIDREFMRLNEQELALHCGADFIVGNY